MSHNTQLQDKIERQLATILYESGVSGVLITITASTVLIFFIVDFTAHPLLLGWWIAMTLILLLRLCDVLWWSKKELKTAFDGKKLARRFAAGTLSTAVLWAVFPFLTFTEFEIYERASAIIILSAMAGGGAAILAANRFLVVTYVTLLLFVPSIRLMTMGSSVEFYLGLLSFLFWVVMVAVGLRASEQFRNSARLYFLNRDLLEEVSREKNLVDQTNVKLNQAYEKLNKVNHELEYKVEERTRELNILAATDELTGLKNRHTFVRTLDLAIVHAKENQSRFSVLFIDLDGFKEINDVRGHIMGDRVLKEVASRLQGAVKNQDFLCRWGGDEFVLVLEENERQVVQAVSNRICKKIALPVELGIDYIEISCTVGIAIYPDHGTHATELLNAADIAMYKLKKVKKNGSMIFEPSFLAKIKNEQRLREGLRKAVELDQLQLYYQPIIPLTKNRPLHYEALLRWRFDEELIPPMVFIPIAEKSGLIHSTGRWVLRRALEDIKAGIFGDDGVVSINISLKQIVESDIVEIITFALQTIGVEPHRLHIEITESVFAQNLQDVASLVSRLRAVGVRISIDDFGTGFSSLAYLQTLPVDTIKIDRSFVRNIDQGGGEIIQATLSIARAFGCAVVAEGIETSYHKNRLEVLNVDFMQGFYFCKPVPREEIIAMNLHNDAQRQKLLSYGLQ